MLILDGQGEEGIGHLRQEKQRKAEPAGVRNQGPTSVKGLCLVIKKDNSVQLDGTRLWENLEASGGKFRVDSKV